MTLSNGEDAAVAASLDFVRRQRDPAFRRHLADIGWHSGQSVVVALDDEPMFSVLAKIIINGATSPCLIVIPHSAEDASYRFLVAEVGQARRRAPWRKAKIQVLDIKPSSSIGMVYSSMQRCGEYVPNAWTQPVVFEKVPVSA